MFIYDRTFLMLEQAIGGSNQKHKVISHNIANINTPGYKKYEIHFEKEIKRAMMNSNLPLKITSEKHISNHSRLSFAPQRSYDTPIGVRADGNNVDIDHEMAEMAKNNIYNNAVINQANKKIAILKYVDSEGRR